jgi:hypothetical protein
MRNGLISAFGAVLLAACWTASCTSLSSDCDLLVSCPKYATGGSGGAGGMTCQTTADCPKTTVCATWACEAGVCKPAYAMNAVSSQIYGDCHVTVCDGMGNKISIADDNDSYDDGNDCTDDACNKGIPSHALKPLGASCGTLGLGLKCDVQGKCVHCLINNDCAVSPTKPTCDKGICVAATCFNNTVDGTETDVDCGGGACSRCADGSLCTSAADCMSGVCMGTLPNPKTCQKPWCFDGVLNGNETDGDCGGTDCVPIGGVCDDGWHCKLPTDCKSGVCKTGLCQPPTCTDGVQNGMETTIDCGGPCPACPH